MSDDLTIKEKGRERAIELRLTWRDAIADRSSTVLEAISRPVKERKYINKISLLSILKQVDGWNQHTARNALLQSGFPLNATLGDLAVSRQKIADFENILDSSFQRWVPNLTIPDGYPFFGKIEDILAQTDVSEFMPAESEESDDPVVPNLDIDDVIEEDEEDDESNTVLDSLDELLGGL